MAVASALIPYRVKVAFQKALFECRKWHAFGTLARLVPPERLMHDGPPNLKAFRDNSKEFFQIYTGLCGLKPDDVMLDVGCGIGRKTIRLTRYLSPRGRYEGIDIVKSGVDWCTRTISRRHPNFRFQLIDVYNPRYHPEGRQSAAEYQYPFPDESFDFVVLASVFTHMRPADAARYLSEVRRVLKPRGRCLISWFLLNPESIGLIATSRRVSSSGVPLCLHSECRVVVRRRNAVVSV